MIRMENLTKVYQSGKGIHDLSLVIQDEGAFGFLGPNGAGKTTVIRVLMGLLKPDTGGAWINGLHCWKDRTEAKKVVAYLPGELNFFENLHGQEFLELLRKMHGNRQEIKNNYEKLTVYLDLDIKQPIRKMSKGMKQKLGIISALMLDSQVLILDEPTSGLDPLCQKAFIDLILEEKNRGKVIFMSSHQFKEVEQICEQVGIIREGVLLTVQEINNLKKSESHIFEVEVHDEEDARHLKQRSQEICCLEVSREEGLKYIIRTTGGFDHLWKLLSELNIKEFSQRKLELEEAFIQYYE